MTSPDMRTLAEGIAERVGAPAQVEVLARWLQSTWDAARARWPTIALAPEALAAHVGEHLGRGGDLEAVLPSLHGEDLFLARACIDGDAAAIEALDREVGPMLRQVLADPKAMGVDAEDLRQHLLERLLVGGPGRAPKLLEYGGRGRLRSWVKVTALRLRIDEDRRRTGRAEPLPDDSLRRIEESISSDMELALLKQRYRGSFKEAFGRVLQELEPSQRALLRLTVVEGLSATEIARLHGVHRATAKRWLAAIREHLLQQTERVLAESLGVDEGELRSVLGLIRSQLDVSMKRHLQDG